MSTAIIAASIAVTTSSGSTVNTIWHAINIILIGWIKDAARFELRKYFSEETRFGIYS